METNLIKANSSKIINSDWYRLLVEDCSAMVIETRFNASWVLLEGYHELGNRILEDISKFDECGMYGQKIVKIISNSIQRSERTIYNAIQFAKRFPDINSLPEGKAITWSKICKKYLPNKAGNCPHDEYENVVTRVCKCCGKKEEIKKPEYIEARMV